MTSEGERDAAPIDAADYDFYMLSPYDRATPDQFMVQFALRPASDVFEVVDLVSDTILFETTQPSAMFDWLRDHPETPQSLYFSDAGGSMFTLTHLPGHLVLGVPFYRFNDARLLTTLRDFNATLGWGCCNFAPPHSLEEARQDFATWRGFKRFENGVLASDEQI